MKLNDQIKIGLFSLGFIVVGFIRVYAGPVNILPSTKYEFTAEVSLSTTTATKIISDDVLIKGWMVDNYSDYLVRVSSSSSMGQSFGTRIPSGDVLSDNVESFHKDLYAISAGAAAATIEVTVKKGVVR